MICILHVRYGMFGPFLFLLFINDIVTDIGSNTRLFACDTSLFIIAKNSDTAAEVLILDLEKKFVLGKNLSCLLSSKENRVFSYLL